MNLAAIDPTPALIAIDRMKRSQNAPERTGFVWTPHRIAASSISQQIAPGASWKLRENKGRSKVWGGSDVLVKRPGERRGRVVCTIVVPFGVSIERYLSQGGAL